MSQAAPALRWWGWGDRETVVPPGLLTLLRLRSGSAWDVVSPPPALSAVRLPEASRIEALRRRLEAAGVRCSDDHEDRLRHAAGRSYVDVLRLRSGVLEEAPDAVLHCDSPSAVAAALRACAETGCAVVPFGGGTSVVGGVRPLRAGFDAVVALDVSGLRGITSLDARSLLAAVAAGTRGPRLEADLARHGLSLGHFPQSFEYASVGGFAATRSAGQASTGHGRFDALVRGLQLLAPERSLNLDVAPSSGAGPSLLQLVLGSEGVLGVITEVTVQVRPAPRLRRYTGWSFPSFAAGCEALRMLAGADRLPDVARLADAEETEASLALAPSAGASLLRRYLGARAQPRPCLLIAGWEGDPDQVGTRMRLAAPVLRRCDGLALGQAPGRSWLRSRFDAPYLRDSLLDRGALVETLETAATWTRLAEVRSAVISALRAELSTPHVGLLIGCHLSHVYASGAALYVTVLAARDGSDPIGQWQRGKAAATTAMLDAGGRLTHHHAVGVDHAPYLERELGAAGIRALHALKGVLDPAGIMNPGKVLLARTG